MIHAVAVLFLSVKKMGRKDIIFVDIPDKLREIK